MELYLIKFCDLERENKERDAMLVFISILKKASSCLLSAFLLGRQLPRMLITREGFKLRNELELGRLKIKCYLSLNSLILFDMRQFFYIKVVRVIFLFHLDNQHHFKIFIAMRDGQTEKLK